MPLSIPRKDSEFDKKQKIIVSETLINLVEWNIDEQWFRTSILPSQAIWEAAWKDYIDPVHRTMFITARKTDARKIYEPHLRKLVAYLKPNVRVPPMKLKEMGIVITTREGNTKRNPAPATCPAVKIDTSVVRRLTLRIYNGETGLRSKPHGVHDMEIWHALLETAPKNISELTGVSFATKSAISFEFSERERGKVFMFCMRWRSTTNKTGPWSEIISARVP